MDTRTKNRINEHKNHSKEAKQTAPCFSMNNAVATFFICECDWFGWIPHEFAAAFMGEDN